MRRWPLVVFGATIAGQIAMAAVAGSIRPMGGGFMLLWISVMAVGAILVARVPGNSVGTLMLAYGFVAGVSGMGIGLAEVRSLDHVPWYEPLAVGLNSAALPLVGFMLLRFPTGSLLSARWRLVDSILVVAAVAGFVGGVINNGWGGDPGQARLEGPLRAEYGEIGDAANNIMNLGLIAVFLAVGSLFVRYRRAEPTERTQLRSVLLAVALVAVFFLTIGPQLSVDSDTTTWDVWVLGGVISLIPLSIGIAIVRHGLYDIDRVISRTVVYGSIVVIIAGVYVAIVFGLGSLLGDRSDSPILPIAATAIVALVFQPARERLERFANRIVFGRRATPYEVLSDFTHRVAATDDAFLADVARSITDGTISTGASVWTFDGGMLLPVSVWPAADDTPSIQLVGATEDLVPGATRSMAIHYDGRTIGALGLTLPAGETLSPADELLIEELVQGLGLALWNRARTADLQANVIDLRASRRRLVAIQDDTRHELERDLHDGAQQRLVATKVRLSIAQQMAAKDGFDHTAASLSELITHVDEAIEQLRDFARGVFPPLLQAEGLGPAIGAHIDRSPLGVETSIEVDRRHLREIESTAYFTVVEALRAIEVDGHASNAVVRIHEVGDEIEIEVTAEHDGELVVAPPDHVRDRVEAFGGRLELDVASESFRLHGVLRTAIVQPEADLELVHP